MPLPWGRLFWTFVVGLCAGIGGYAIYRGDLRWELPTSTHLEAIPFRSDPEPADLPAVAEVAKPVEDTPPPAESAAVSSEPASEDLAEAGRPEVQEVAALPSVEAGAPEVGLAEVVAPELVTDPQVPEAPAVEAPVAVPESVPEPEPKPEVESELRMDWLIVPGVRVGEVVAGITESKLEDIYGVGNVARIEVDLGGGFTEPGTALFPADPERELHILWSSAKPNRVPRVLHVKGKAWKTAEGIGLGTKLSQLEVLNGNAFTLSGFGWDYSGAVVSWDSGRLGELLQTRGRVQLWLQPPTGVKPGKLVGDKDFRSSNPAMRKLDPRVYALTVELPAGTKAAARR